MATDRTPLALLPAGFLELEGMYERWPAAPAPHPQVVVLNRPLAAELGLDVGALRSAAGAAALLGHGLGPEVVTLAQAYVQLADQQIGQSQFDAAGRSLAKARELAPDDPSLGARDEKLKGARGG